MQCAQCIHVSYAHAYMYDVVYSAHTPVPTHHTQLYFVLESGIAPTCLRPVRAWKDAHSMAMARVGSDWACISFLYNVAAAPGPCAPN